jgi:hypothetical protein
MNLNEELEKIIKKVNNSKILGKVIPRNLDFTIEVKNQTKFLDNIYAEKKIRNVDRIFCLISNIISTNQIPLCKQCNKNHSIFKSSGVGFSEVCSQKCGVKYGGTKNKDPEVSIKAAIIRKQTMKERYNVDHISQLDSIKKQKNKTAIKNFGSLKAAYYETAQKTVQQNYKVDNISKLDSIKEKKKETSRQNFGTDYPIQNEKKKEEYKQKIIETYGVDNISKLDSVKEKKKETCLTNWGEDNYSKTAEFIISNSRENNHNWRGGISYNKYCEIFLLKEFRDIIIERDSIKCLNPHCSKADNTDIIIHHIDYNKQNCSPANLITLCRSCNSIANFDRNWHESWYKAIILKRYGKRGL